MSAVPVPDLPPDAAAGAAPGLPGWRPRLVALDVDGTVADYDGWISDAVRGAVARARAAGAHVVLATGRSLLGTRPIVESLGLTDGWCVCSNGTLTATVRPWRVAEAVTFDASPAVRALLEVAPDTLVAVEDVERGYLVNAPFPDGELFGDQIVTPLRDMIGRPVHKVVLRRPDSTPQEFFRLVEQAGLKGVDYVIGFTAWLDVVPVGVSKASALDKVRRRLGVPVEATAAVGDGYNDVEMLRWAGRGIAMGNAPAAVQDVADEVTWGVEDDGVAVVLDRWFAGDGQDSTAEVRHAGHD